MGNVLIAAIVAGLVWWIIRFYVRARHRERALLEARGEQTASEFAALFPDESERRVAEKLYPKLQTLTLSESVPLRPEDMLFTQLEIDDEDLTDEIDGVLAEFGRNQPTDREWKLAFGDGVKTVGELVTAVSRLI